tara:strand:- start:17497 stop:18786 length:1290 start_codon:yes stop_codon:yes gene_type:complete
MNDLTPQFSMRHELRGEFRVLKVLVFCSSIYLFLQLASMFRLFGVSGIPPLLLLGYRILDLLVIGSFFLMCRAKLKTRLHDLPLLLMLPLPILIGVGQGNTNITFFNDIILFMFFILKVIVIRTLILRFMEKTDFDAVFRVYARKIIRRSILAAILALFLALAALSAGITFYYQAPAELTFAAALALAQGHVPTYLAILALAAFGGKRGILAGIAVVGLLGFLNRKNIVRALLSFLALGAALIIALGIFEDSTSLGNAQAMRRLTGTWIKLTSVANETKGWEEFLLLLDPGRFVEYVSLKPHLEGWAFWFGNGYGFRYSLDPYFLSNFGIVAIEDTVTNAHFTPLAIMAKFGVLGLFLWFTQCAAILFSSWNSRSYFQTACRLGFISMLVQSMFSFNFFISFFTPIFIAGATLRRTGRRLDGGQVACVD